MWTRFVSFAEKRPIYFLVLWTALYIAAVLPRSLATLSYDELLTYYGATAPTFHQFYAGITHFDFNPPLLYGFVKLSVLVLGDSPFAVRVPSLLAFGGAAYLLFWQFRRQGQSLYGLLALAILWSFGFVRFASEARPYALALFFFVLAFVSWSSAVGKDRWTFAHTGLALAIAGMILSHCFAAPFALSIAVGELVRTKRARKWDYRIWMALAFPVPLLLLYSPLWQSTHHLLYAPEHIAGWTTAFSFYGRVILANMRTIALIAAAAVLVSSCRHKEEGPLFPLWQWAFLLSALFVPVLLMLYAIHVQMPYADRYGIWISLPITLLLVWVVDALSKRTPAAANAASLLLCVNFCMTNLDSFTFRSHTEEVSRSLMLAAPGLPIVAAVGSRFLELDHEMPDAYVSRLYYLTDPEAEVRYTHANYFQNFGMAKQVYPVRGKIASFAEFVAIHPQFLIVLFPGDEPQLWIVKKLEADGIHVRPVPGAPFYLETVQRDLFAIR